MRVKLTAGDDEACGHYRMLWPGQANDEHHDIEFADGIEGMHVRAGQVVGVEDPCCDLVVIQRPLTTTLADVIPYLKEYAAVAVEIDDDFAALTHEHPAWHDMVDGNNPGHLLRACRAADMVYAPSWALLERYAPSSDHGRLLRNYLPGFFFGNGIRPARPLTVGWTGTRATHPGDLEVTGGALRRVLAVTGATFRVVGHAEGVAEALDLGEPAWGTGWLTIPEYAAALPHIDVGIVPLRDSAFNASKSCIKGLEFAAAGVPFVASPTPEYLWLADQGIGEIAYSPADWEDKLKRLLCLPLTRHDRGREYQEIARGEFGLRDNAWRWSEAWEQTVANAAIRAALRRAHADH